MKRTTRALFVLASLVTVSCNGAAGPNAPYAAIFSDRISLRTGDFEIPAGDVFECFYTPLITDHDIVISRGVGTQQEGGHHLTVHYTNVHRDVGHHPCIDAEMATWRQLTAADPRGGEVSYAVDGLGTLLPAGSQIVLQAHYINLQGARTVQDEVDVLIPPATEVRALGGTLVFDEENFEIPARGAVRTISTCTLAHDFQVASLLGHEHEYGARFSLERINVDGTTEMLYDFPWEAAYASHPPIEIYGLDTPLLLPRGTRLRQTCEWRNTDAASVIFPREMCVSYMNTFPSPDGAMEFCEVETTDVVTP